MNGPSDAMHVPSQKFHPAQRRAEGHRFPSPVNMDVVRAGIVIHSLHLAVHTCPSPITSSRPVPELPGKSTFFAGSTDEFIEKRRQGLQQFLEK